MPERRSLTEGLKETPEELEKAGREFVFGEKKKSKPCQPKSPQRSMFCRSTAPRRR